MPATFVFFAVLYLAFAFTGVLTALPGPLLPLLAKKWLLTDAQAGSIVGAQFLGNVLGSFFASRNLRTSLLLGLTLIATGTGLFMFLSWPGLRISFLCFGMGLGFSIPAINFTVAAMVPERRAISLNLLNCVWGLGAIASPVLVLVAHRFASVEKLLAILSLSAALLLIFFASWPRPEIVPPAPAQNGRTLAHATRLLLFFGITFFLYVGTETCVASWIGIYTQRTFPGSHLLGFSVLTYFWVALALGRGASAYVLRWVRERMLYSASAATALVAFCVILGGKSPASVVGGTVLCGLAMAPIFPLLLSFASGPLLSRPHSGWVLACAPLGGALLPWATGQISTSYSALHSGLLLPAAAIFLLLAMGLSLPYLHLAAAREAEHKPQ